jgi:hypothetical protein
MAIRATSRLRASLILTHKVALSLMISAHYLHSTRGPCHILNILNIRCLLRATAIEDKLQVRATVSVDKSQLRLRVKVAGPPT